MSTTLYRFMGDLVVELRIGDKGREVFGKVWVDFDLPDGTDPTTVNLHLPLLPDEEIPVTGFVPFSMLRPMAEVPA